MKKIVQKINAGHLILMSVTIGLNIVFAALLHSKIQCLAVAIWLIMPCKDRNFGWGRKLFWARQTAFIIGTVITFFIATL